MELSEEEIRLIEAWRKIGYTDMERERFVLLVGEHRGWFRFVIQLGEPVPRIVYRHSEERG